jgi:biotin-dependent carboxylase-like uncharacterized protein
MAALHIIKPGVQATLQGEPRSGHRHLGVPWSGAADSVSLALANRLAGNRAAETGIEITYGNFSVEICTDLALAVTGAEARLALNGQTAPFHETMFVQKGDILELGSPETGLRSYIAVSGGIRADNFLDSPSTYLPAGFGGHKGRALKPDDVVETERSNTTLSEHARTPDALRYPIGSSFALRATEGPDYSESYATLWTEQFRATRRASRIGFEIEGNLPQDRDARSGNLPSAGLFPGALQVPPQGRGFLLLSDCQTTGGYPHLLQVNRSDRHQLGQVRPGDSVIFLHRSADQAAEDLRDKHALLSSWVPDILL